MHKTSLLIAISQPQNLGLDEFRKACVNRAFKILILEDTYVHILAVKCSIIFDLELSIEKQMFFCGVGK